ncbi:IS3 family transposase [Anaerotignum neopropionicum]|nr:IS3 family transposase [Anaerotignum neopropionicum]
MAIAVCMDVAVLLGIFNAVYMDYYNNRRSKAKRKGLPPALHRQQALSAA